MSGEQGDKTGSPQLLRYVNRYQAVESDNNSGKMSDPEKQKFFRKQVEENGRLQNAPA